jgi:hypothetical protein
MRPAWWCALRAALVDLKVTVSDLAWGSPVWFQRLYDDELGCALRPRKVIETVCSLRDSKSALGIHR